MASAIFASRNEPYWSECRVSLSKYPEVTRLNPQSTRKFVSNSNPAVRLHDFPSGPNLWKSNEPSPGSAAPLAELHASPFLGRNAIDSDSRKAISRGYYLTFNISAYSRRELKELRQRWISELETVRALRNVIETREFECRTSYSDSQFAGREVSRRASFSINPALDSSAGAAAVVSKEKKTKKIKLGSRSSKTPTEKDKVRGQKRAARAVSAGRTLKRAAVSDSQMDRLVQNMMKRCGVILAKLMGHRHGWVFNKPVDVVRLGLVNYHNIIKHPMDLGTVRSRLHKNEYGSPLDFASDVRLTFNNAMIYNLKGQCVYNMAELLLNLFEEMFNRAHQKFEAERQRVITAEKANRKISAPMAPVILPDPVNIANNSYSELYQLAVLKPEPIQVQAPLSPAPTSMKPAATSKSLPLVKAKDKTERVMSFKERVKLGFNLQHLPSEKLEQVVEIIRKRSYILAQDGDEIELDIDVLDNETLLELDRFVRAHKTSLTRLKTQGFVDKSITTTQISKSPTGQAPEEVGHPRKEGLDDAEMEGDVDIVEVDIGEEIPAIDFTRVEIDKDAATKATSSSSSSSSSSSDSDSGSDSDEEREQPPYVDTKEGYRFEDVMQY